jgi:phosphoribosylanthranilate isomerase
MTIWIKICGMTTPEAVEASLNANVDAIGFVFAESIRQVTPAKAASLAAPARGRVLCTAVTDIRRSRQSTK